MGGLKQAGKWFLLIITRSRFYIWYINLYFQGYVNLYTYLVYSFYINFFCSNDVMAKAMPGISNVLPGKKHMNRPVICIKTNFDFDVPKNIS